VGARNHGAKTAFDGFVESGLLARLNANVGEFENHGVPFALNVRGRIGVIFA
jgi:hypothetical protein